MNALNRPPSHSSFKTHLMSFFNSSKFTQITFGKRETKKKKDIFFFLDLYIFRDKKKELQKV